MVGGSHVVMAVQGSGGRRTYVLDTSVLLADHLALERFEEHDVVVPLVVISELEAKRGHPELGYMARASLRYLERCRTTHGTLTEPIPVGDGGTLRVELNHVDSSALPAPMRSEANDGRILAVAQNLAADFRVARTQTRQLDFAFGLRQEPAQLEEFVDALPLLGIHDGVR